MSKKLFSIFAAALFLAGCASGVKHEPSQTAANVSLSANNQVDSVSLSMTDDAKKKVADNLKFNPDELLNHVKRALEANSLINSYADMHRPDLEIQVKDIRVRSNFSAVMWGFLAGADSVVADIILKDSAGTELDRFEVSASYALGGLGGGQDDARMGWLYEKFAEETVKELTKQ